MSKNTPEKSEMSSLRLQQFVGLIRPTLYFIGAEIAKAISGAAK